ncbi:MAG: transcription antitermination factor NusB [Pseudomonadota bacterium]
MTDIEPRPLARQRLIQAMYQWHLTGASSTDISEQFLADGLLNNADRDYFKDILPELIAQNESLSAMFSKHLDRPYSQLDPVALSILLLGAYELNFRSDVPYKVTINEAIELAKMLGPEGSHKFINGVLDKVAESVRNT